MKFYEKDNIFCLLEQDQTPPKNSKLYEIRITSDFHETSKEIFPQFDLKIFSNGLPRYKNKLDIIYKNIYKFTPHVTNKPIYIIRLLNELNTGDIEEVLLRHIKNSVYEEEYLKIKSSLNKLNSIEEVKLENIKLRKENVENISYKQKFEEVNKLNLKYKEELKIATRQLEIRNEILKNNWCFKIKRFFIKNKNARN